MKIDVKQELINAELETLKRAHPTEKDGDKPKMVPVTVGMIIRDSMMAVDPEEEKKNKTSTEEYMQKWAVAFEIAKILKSEDKNEIDVTVEEYALIKKCIPKAFDGALVVGQVMKMIAEKKA